MKEIITLQFGNKSNWVGSNYWNLQSESLSAYLQNQENVNYLMESVFYETEGNSFFPRTILFEEKGNYGSLNCQTGHFKVSTSNSEPDVISNPSENWYTLKRSSCLDSLGVETRIRSFDLRMYRVFPLVTISFSRLVSSSFASFLVLDTLHWSSINNYFYHPSSINELRTHSTLFPLSNYIQGHSLTESDSFEDFFDSFRKQLEWADAPMALQCIVDMDGGWSGISQKYLEEARSELGSVPILLYGIYDSKNGYSESIKRTKEYHEDMIMNRYYSLYSFNTTGSLFTLLDVASTSPLFLSDAYPSIYTASFLSSLLMNNTTLPYRLYSSSRSLYHWTRLMQRGEYQKQLYYSCGLLDEYLNTPLDPLHPQSIYIPLYSYQNHQPLPSFIHYSINCVSPHSPLSPYYEAYLKSYLFFLCPLRTPSLFTYYQTPIYVPHQVPLAKIHTTQINPLVDIQSPSALPNEALSILKQKQSIDLKEYVSMRSSAVNQDELDLLHECENYLQTLSEEYSN